MLNLRKKWYYKSVFNNAQYFKPKTMIGILAHGVRKEEGLKFLSDYVKDKMYRMDVSYKELLDIALLISLPFNEIDGNIIEKYEEYSNEKPFNIIKNVRYLFDNYDNLAKICKEIPIPDYIWDNYNSEKEFNTAYLSNIIKRLNSIDYKYTLFCEKEMYRTNLKEMCKTFIDCYSEKGREHLFCELIDFMKKNNDVDSISYLISKNIDNICLDIVPHEEDGMTLKLK